MELTPDQELAQARAELARLRAGLAAGLTPEQSARLQGSTPEELEADARAFAAELGAGAPAGNQSGGPRGGDVDAPTGVAAGAAAYQRKHPKREPRPAPTEAEQRRNPFQFTSYSMER
ncbi:hypothetical protein ACH4VS_05110 [Streptomyces hygroscopicus]|uniref:hypothetical protein n=1 Tax=Streptomyces hygroscopicus TaxID=1912 RepID=UPI0008346746|nr:hypothetical protein [Streptomyces hygroscopicus]GLV73457.1 hypothetical protein Shyhy02_14590 [Streptomyces hygroscopicus subsp. hygroscopicus]